MVELVVSFSSPAAFPLRMAISRRSTALKMASRSPGGVSLYRSLILFQHVVLALNKDLKWPAVPHAVKEFPGNIGNGVLVGIDIYDTSRNGMTPPWWA